MELVKLDSIMVAIDVDVGPRDATTVFWVPMEGCDRMISTIRQIVVPSDGNSLPGDLAAGRYDSIAVI